MHAFAEGVAIYDDGHKRTYFLPHPAGAVFSLLIRHSEGLDESSIMRCLADGDHAEETMTFTAALEELEQQGLVTPVA